MEWHPQTPSSPTFPSLFACRMADRHLCTSVPGKLASLKLSACGLFGRLWIWHGALLHMSVTRPALKPSQTRIYQDDRTSTGGRGNNRGQRKRSKPKDRIGLPRRHGRRFEAFKDIKKITVPCSQAITQAKTCSTLLHNHTLVYVESLHAPSP